MAVSGYLRCLRPDPGEILWEGGPLDQRGWKISKLWLPWQLLSWQPKNLLKAHKTPWRLWNFIRRGIGLESIVAMDFCYHGNRYVVFATKDVFFKIDQLPSRNMLDVTMTPLVTWVTSPDTGTSHWPSMTSWSKNLTSQYQEMSPRSLMTS